MISERESDIVTQFIKLRQIFSTLPDGGAAGGLDGVPDGEEGHEADQVEEQEHGAKRLKYI